jgi:hypothetical protein
LFGGSFLVAIDLEIASSLKTRYIEAVTLQSLAAVYRKLSRSEEALDYCDRALNIATESDIPFMHECQELKQMLLLRLIRLKWYPFLE